ncbi:MAG: peptidoglycan DD-metalloendopeptidase family protein [Chitinophagaceae bacterium]
MKGIHLVSFFFFVCVLTQAQSSPISPCITAAEYKLVENRCNTNAHIYMHPNTGEKIMATSFSWPLKAAAGLIDCSYYYISAHVDHDNTATAIKDYNCGTVTYDGHRGTDIAIGPFPFYKMDNDQVEVIAAAPGTIIDKHDGEFDKNCATNSLTANYVIIQHADGSRAFYWHMKKKSVTAKAIGQTVVTGEKLGVVGSSGSSTGPHLHFEVWTGSTAATMIDPFAGTCNTLNATSWWASQKPYREQGIIKASVHTTDLVWPACPATETPNESTSYTIPFQGAGLAPGYAKFYVFIRNETSGVTGTMSILNPNATVFNTWTYTSTNNYKFSYWGFSKLLPTTNGTYTFRASYNGNTCDQTFQIINSTTGIDEFNKNNNVQLYPNPTSSVAMLRWSQPLLRATLIVYNTGGQIVKTISNISGTQVNITRNGLQSGIYFIRMYKQEQLILKGRWLIVD